MFHYDVAVTFVYELVYYKIAPKTFMINAMWKQMAWSSGQNLKKS